MKLYTKKAARWFLKKMFNNGAQFVELNSTPYQIGNNIFYKSPKFVINYRFIFREILSNLFFSLLKWEISGFFNRPGVK